MKNSTPNVGELGEKLVAEWLQAQNWVILHHRWRCRWGEIDLIAQQQESIRDDAAAIETGNTEHEPENIKIQEIPHRHSPPHPVTEEDAETRRHGDAESSRETCDAGHETPKGVNVQGFEASSHSLIGTPGIGGVKGPRPIPVPASPPPRVPASLNPSPVLAFVEVKTRSPRNWDANGLLAITPQKQAKLWQTAHLFLAQSPVLANFPCRFDVALVSCQRISQRSNREYPDILSFSSAAKGEAIPRSSVQLGQPLFRAGYRLILQDYISSAFD